MQINEISTCFGVTYIGQHMGHSNGKHALINVYKIIPIPERKRNRVMIYIPSLMPMTFFGNENDVIYIKDEDILLNSIVRGDQLKKYLELVN